MGNRDVITYHHITSAIDGTSTIDVTVGSHRESIGIQYIVFLHDKTTLTNVGTQKTQETPSDTPKRNMRKNIINAIFQAECFQPIEEPRLFNQIDKATIDQKPQLPQTEPLR